MSERARRVARHPAVRVLGSTIGAIVLVLAFIFLVHLLFFMPPYIGAPWAGFVGLVLYWLHARPDPDGRVSRLTTAVRLRPLSAPPRWTGRVVVATLLVMFGVAGFVQFGAGPLELPEDGYFQQVMRYTETSAGWLAFGFAAAVVIPFGEELCFRGRMQRAMETWLSPAAAILVTALLFAAMHLDRPHPLVLLVPFALGAMCGAAVWLSGSLWIGVLLHGLWNGLLAFGSRFAAQPPPEAQPGAGLVVVSLLAVVTGGIAWLRLLRAGRTAARAPDPIARAALR